MRQYIQYFRVSQWAVPVLVTLIIGSHSMIVISDIVRWEPYPDTEFFVIPYLFDCKYGTEGPFTPARNYLKWWVHCASYEITGNANFIPVLFSIGLMPVLYLLAVKMTNDKIVGLVALVAFTFNPIYRQWDSVGTYDNIWSFFLLLSIYLLYKTRNWQYSYLNYIVSIFSKIMALAYLPVYIAFVYDTKYGKRRKGIYTILVVLTLVLAAGIVYYDYKGLPIIGDTIKFHPENALPALVRNISLFWQVLPLVLGTFGVYVLFKSSAKIPGVTPVVFFIIYSFIITVPIHVFTNQLTFTYRYVPFAAFLSIFIGMTVLRFGNWFVESRLK